jgi:hypothetical protein
MSAQATVLRRIYVSASLFVSMASRRFFQESTKPSALSVYMKIVSLRNRPSELDRDAARKWVALVACPRNHFYRTVERIVTGCLAVGMVLVWLRAPQAEGQARNALPGTGSLRSISLPVLGSIPLTKL